MGTIVLVFLEVVGVSSFTAEAYLLNAIFDGITFGLGVAVGSMIGNKQ